MTKKLDTMEELVEFTQRAVDLAKKMYRDDVSETDFTIIQPLSEGQGMIFQVKDDEYGQRTSVVDIMDALTILPTTDATLDIYGEGE
ncbi:hypothetical protein [Listeria seeligeri]|uniref:hypothetical protein n=1 Tax=Listeria seeligeri TaxID=1640 RepID=UPI001887D80E|nr:hypothetical protein [Listeria seeligeri]MBF2440362.1 hypothetical protein [Listeria seeligeri]